MIPHSFPEHRFLLGSKSPRRQHLLKELGLQYELVDIDVEEIYPEELKGVEIARYLCELKANAFNISAYPDKSLLITADTIVWLDGMYIGKPSGKKEAIEMLKMLSGKTHQVFTGVCLKSNHSLHVFHAETSVSFKILSDAEIHFYIDHHRPYDKAGSYGIQDWIGYTGVTGIQGCYYNVMGFPVQLFWEELKKFLKDDTH
ncbi:MAG: septum formation protein Maf [Bacteroidales bacterium]|nr:septum formation protein Maf [Bacteroidales bacterium]